MTDDPGQVIRVLRDLAEDLDAGSTSIQAASAYGVPDIDPDDVSFTSDDWDGSDAVASYPDPSSDDVSVTDFRQNFLLYPKSDDDQDAKSAYKLPIRESHQGQVNTNALEAVLAAINGARGGVEGVDTDTLRRAFRQAVRLLVAAGEYESSSDAPDFEAEAAQAAQQTPQASLEAQATGRIEVSPDDASAALTASDSDALDGIVWGAGNHDLNLGGSPARVHVPKDTIQPTFEALKEDVQAGEVGIGTDHPDPDSVAAQTGAVNIGKAEDVALSADGKYIVMTDSTLTSQAAKAAHERGDFDDLDYSVVADVAVRRDADGDPVTKDGRIVIDATRIRRIDIVNDGAVDAASIGSVPELAASAKQVVQAADAKQPADAVTALRAAASALSNLTSDMSNFDPSDFDDPQTALEAAADVIENQDEELQAAKARASAFEDLLSAHDVDREDFEDPAEAAQAVIDQQTEQTRERIAELEANELPGYDTEDVEARKAELAGKSPAALQNTLNARKAEAFDAQQKKQSKGAAAAKSDQRGRMSASDLSGGAGGGDADADDVALSAMDGSDRIAAEANGQSPSEYVQKQYGLDASQYDAGDELHEDILDTIQGGD